MIKKTTREAFAQITKNNYAQEIIKQKIKNRIEMVMVFSGKKVDINYKTIDN